jgi:hypothetical protein
MYYMQSTSHTVPEGYIIAAHLAKKHQVSLSTVRRRIREGKLFPGARKADLVYGDRWLIPLAEADAVSLADLSPKVNHFRNEHASRDGDSHGHPDQDLNLAYLESLELRIARLERLLVKYLSLEVEEAGQVKNPPGDAA